MVDASARRLRDRIKNLTARPTRNTLLISDVNQQKRSESSSTSEETPEQC
jgi:hypothetical protein